MAGRACVYNSCDKRWREQEKKRQLNDVCLVLRGESGSFHFFWQSLILVLSSLFCCSFLFFAGHLQRNLAIKQIIKNLK